MLGRFLPSGRGCHFARFPLKLQKGDGSSLDRTLDLALRSRGITHLVVAGVAVEICVNCTVLSASAREYRVTVATDAVGALEDWTRRACFEIWRRKFARLAETDGIVAELREGRGPRPSVMK